MLLTIITIMLIAAMAVNHAVNGVGCWGLQAGGPTSAVIYDLQILLALIALVWLFVSLSRRPQTIRLGQLLVIGISVLNSIVTHVLFGWTAHTSIHGLGPENLLAYLSIALTTLLISTRERG